MTDLSTYAGQTAHYAAVRQRLWNPRPVKVIELPPPPKAWVPNVPPPESTAPFDFHAPPGWQSILRFVSLKTGVPERTIMSRDRTVPVVHARYMTMALMKRHLDASLPMIGRRWGADHTTVLHAIRRYESGEMESRMNSCQHHKDQERLREKASQRPRRYPVMKWTPKRLAAAQELRASGMKLKHIAEHFDVSDNAMQAALKRAEVRQAASE